VIRPWIAVIHRVNEGSIEAARPSRHVWKPGKPCRYHNDPRGNRASCRVEIPVAVIAVKTRGLNLEPRLEAMVHHILLQVLHELVACYPSAEVTWNGVARKMRERTDGVQVQTVIAAAPRLPHTPAFDVGGVDAAGPQCRRSSQSSGTSTDDDYIVHSATLLTDLGPYGSRSDSERAAKVAASA
jgi:hypothetical protein